MEMQGQGYCHKYFKRGLKSQSSYQTLGDVYAFWQSNFMFKYMFMLKKSLLNSFRLTNT